MTMPNFPSTRRLWRCLAAALALGSVLGCSALRPSTTPAPAFYTLDAAGRTAPAASAPAPQAAASAPVLIINPPHAAAGFDSQRIIYLREPHRLEYFAHSEWVDPPARMLTPMLVSSLQSTGAFRAVVLTPSAAAGDLRLDTELIRLQQEFSSGTSATRFTLRATLVDDKTRRVLAWREFERAVPAPSVDPYGGVLAANRAVQAVLEELAAFCAQAAHSWRAY